MINFFRKNRFFGGMICHRVTINLGDSFFYIVVMWVLYDLTKDPFYTAMGGFLFSMADALNFFCGPMIDRCRKKWLLLMTSVLQFFVILGLYLFLLHGELPIGLLLLSIPIFDLMSKMTYSIHNALIPALMKKEDFITANTILSVTNTGIDFIFNAVSGFFLAFLCLETIFMMNSLINLTALVIAIFLFRKMPLQDKVGENETKKAFGALKDVWKNYWNDLKKGMAFITNKTILSLMIPLIGLSLFYAVMLVNLPVLSDRIFGSAMGYGFMLTLLAVGSMSGAAFSRHLTKRFTLGKLFPLLFLWGGASWILAAFLIHSAPLLGMAFLVSASTALGAVNIIFGTIFQQIPPENMIARVNTVNLSLIVIASLLGSLFGGMIAKLSADFAPFVLCGVGYLLIALMMKANMRVKTLPKIDAVGENIL